MENFLKYILICKSDYVQHEIINIYYYILIFFFSIFIFPFSDPNKNDRPSILQQVGLPIKDSTFCQRLKRNYPRPDTILCAGGGDGKDTCRGDSGGPLTLSNNILTQSYVVGVTSLGPSVCGARNTQGLYTNVYPYIDWILNTLEP